MVPIFQLDHICIHGACAPVCLSEEERNHGDKTAYMRCHGNVLDPLEHVNTTGSHAGAVEAGGRDWLKLKRNSCTNSLSKM